MSFVFYPNHEHRCPNLMHCPHIGGAALGYLVSLANENDEQRDWLFRQLDATREEMPSGGVGSSSSKSVCNNWKSN